MESGIALIAHERQRQIDIEGWSAAHDDAYQENDLVRAAVAYIVHARGSLMKLPDSFWPWHISWWKPKDRKTNLIKAGALIAAEIDRLQREESQSAA